MEAAGSSESSVCTYTRLHGVVLQKNVVSVFKAVGTHYLIERALLEEPDIKLRKLGRPMWRMKANIGIQI
jgi:hypothetical protein